MELTYTRYGDYLLPDIELTPVEVRPMNRYGRMRRAFLEENEPLWYNEMAMTETLYPHLWDVSEQAEIMMNQLITSLLEQNPPPDKQMDQMGWVRHMNMLQAQAEEVVIAELVTVPYRPGTEA